MIANRPEPGEQDVELSAGERASWTSLFAGAGRPEIGFGPSGRGEERDSFVVPGGLAELFQELVDSSMPSGVSAAIAFARYAEWWSDVDTMRPGGFEPPANGLEVRTGLLHATAADPIFVQLCGVEAAPGYL